MQLSNITVRLGGSVLHTVCKVDVTPAEILVLQHIHGEDGVIDIRPSRFDKRRQQAAEFERLAQLYDAGAGSFVSSNGEENSPIMSKLFPGAMKKLPVHLKDIGLGHLMSDAATKAAVKAAANSAPETPAVDETVEDEIDPEDGVDGGDGNDPDPAEMGASETAPAAE
jgi:hypothetical protein